MITPTVSYVSRPIKRFTGCFVRIFALWGVACAILPGSAARGDGAPPFILAGEGADPFRLGIAASCGEPFVTHQLSGVASGPMFWRALDLSPDGQQLFGVSDDELYVIDMAHRFELLGQIGFSAGQRFWFIECLNGADTFTYADPGAVGPVIWYVRASIVLTDLAGQVLSEFDIEQSGVVYDGSQLGVLVDEILEEPGVLSTQLTVSLTADGVADLDFVQLSGNGDASVNGTFVAMTPNAAGADPIPLPVAGLTVAADGSILALSEAQWDPFGEAALYELFVSSNSVQAEYVSTPDAQNIYAIELADDGRLFGAGESLYLIDSITGSSLQLASLAGAQAVELDFGAAGRLHAMARRLDGSTSLLDITPFDAGAAPVAQFGMASFWGFVVLDRDPGDLDADGDVDVDDVDLFAAEFSGGLSGPFVPPGVPEPTLDTLAVPFVPDYLGVCPSISTSHPQLDAMYFMDATDIGSHGVVVEGLPTDDQDSSVRYSLAHNDDVILLSVQVVDDHRSNLNGDDVVEFYFDTNNSDSPMREGDANGFRAFFDSEGEGGGDVGAFAAWCAQRRSLYQPGYRIQFLIDKTATNMQTGGTYGFDLAVRDTDQPPDVPVRYFFFSQDTNGEQDEGQWGDLFLAPGPLPAQASDPIPQSGSIGVNPDVVLTWSASPQVTDHRVWLGADPDELVCQGSVSSTTIGFDALTPGATYYWRIDEVNTNGLQRGRIWRFATAPSAADFDGDGDVDVHDERRLFQRPLGDPTGDGVIDDADYAVIASALGSMAGDPEYDAAVDYDSDGAITAADLGIWQCHSVRSGNLPIGDFDGDGDVDDDDLIVFVDCLEGPVLTANSTCMAADLTLDNHVDLRDVALVQQIFGEVQP